MAIHSVYIHLALDVHSGMGDVRRGFALKAVGCCFKTTYNSSSEMVQALRLGVSYVVSRHPLKQEKPMSLKTHYPTRCRLAAVVALALCLAGGSTARAAGLLIADGGFGGQLEIEEHVVDPEAFVEALFEA